MEKIIEILKDKNKQVLIDNMDDYDKAVDRYNLNESKLNIIKDIDYTDFSKNVANIELEDFSDKRKISIESTLGSIMALTDINHLLYSEKLLAADTLCINSLEYYSMFLPFLTNKDVMSSITSLDVEYDDKIEIMEHILDYIESNLEENYDYSVAIEDINKIVNYYSKVNKKSI